MNELTTDALTVLAVSGVVWALSSAGLPERLQPLAALAIGILFQCGRAYYTAPHPDYSIAVAVGIGSGLMAAGYQITHPVVTQATKAAVRKAASGASATADSARSIRFQSPVNVAPPTPEPPAPAL